MQKKTYFYVTAVIFLIVGLVHFFKIFIGFQIQIFGAPYPLWLSWVEMIISLSLAYVGFRLGSKE